jgi:hypothetical protein
MNPFNRNRVLALIVLLIGGIAGWYGLILLTNPHNKPVIPTQNQWFGLLFTIFIGVLIWINKCFTIVPYTE